MQDSLGNLKETTMKHIIVLVSAMFLFACAHHRHHDHDGQSCPHHKDGATCSHHGGGTCPHDKEGMSCPMSKGVSFVSPKDGETVPTKFKVVFGINGMDVKPAGDKAPNSGHHHLIIDGKALPKGQVVPKDDKNLHFGKGQTEAEVTLTPGEHTLTMQFADLNHLSLGEEWSKTIKVTVKAK